MWEMYSSVWLRSAHASAPAQVSGNSSEEISESMLHKMCGHKHMEARQVLDLFVATLPSNSKSKFLCS